MEGRERALNTIDPQTPSVARMYDYLLGGKDNYAADRTAIEEVIRRAPDTPFMARENRAFLRRAVRFLADAGVRQFLDIGAGLPTQGNVHEIAQQVAPDARVVYIDVDPVVLTHGRALLDAPGVSILQGDVRQPEKILSDPDLRKLIDLDEPVAVLMLAILHFVDDDDDPPGIVSRLRAAMAPGSYLTISHVTADFDADRRVRAAGAVYEKATSQITLRSRDEVMKLFEGFELVSPGLTTLSLWRPDPSTKVPEDANRQWCYAGVARKPTQDSSRGFRQP
jgi:hypothetical protein